MRLTETSFFKFLMAFLVAVVNVLFYTLGYPETGAKAAWEVHPLFFCMWQGIFLYACIGMIYFGITKT